VRKTRVILSGAYARELARLSAVEGPAWGKARAETCVILSGAYGTRMRAIAQSKDWREAKPVV